MADTIKKGPSPAGSSEQGAEKRREKRYEVSHALQKHIKLRIKSGNEFVPAVLGNFSRNGILFESPFSFKQGNGAECLMSITMMQNREISFGIEVRYCYEDHGSYITGASITTISDPGWFDAYVKAHDVIVLLKD